MPDDSHLTDPDLAQLPGNHQETAAANRATYPTTIVCDLAEGYSFSPGSSDTPHIPILAAFGADRLHVHRLHGSWDLARAAVDHAGTLFRSVSLRSSDDGKPTEWVDLTFRFGPRSFLFADCIRIAGYATTTQEAEEMVTKFDQAYNSPPAPSGGSFHLIRTGREIDSELVPLGVETLLGDDTFRLHYGSKTSAWHQDFTTRLHASNHGLSILEGSPGTGKTSYLRHLMGTLKDTHRFYFIPPATINVLSDPDFIGFWAAQRRRHAKRKFVVILEDSDAALMTRGSDNRAHVSAILNLSDGMLADFLRLQIICTINCRMADIDQALLRPGRLLCHHVFSRLDHPSACRLAAHLGRSLTDVRDYSLAEVFADATHATTGQPRIGFLPGQ